MVEKGIHIRKTESGIAGPKTKIDRCVIKGGEGGNINNCLTKGPLGYEKRALLANKPRGGGGNLWSRARGMETEKKKINRIKGGEVTDQKKHNPRGRRRESNGRKSWGQLA